MERGAAKWCLGVVLALALCALVAPEAAAQTNDEINAGLQFNFSPPGARTMALGNAFVGRADDATAAFANPAGLVWLTRPEVSTEARSSTFTTRYPHLGSATGQPTACQREKGWWPLGGTDNCLDTQSGPGFRDWQSDTDGLSFFSYVHVFGARGRGDTEPRRSGRMRERWRLAAYRHELANFEAQIRGSEGSFIRGLGTPSTIRSRLAGMIGDLRLSIENVGVSAAFEVTDNVSLGAGVAYYDFQFDAQTRRYRSVANDTLLDDFFVIPQDTGDFPALPGPVDFSEENEFDRHIQTGDDSDVGVVAGLLWRSRSGDTSAGIAYRSAPRFEFDYTFRWQAKADSEALGNPDITDPGIERALSGGADFHVPDYLSVGFFRQFSIGRRSRQVPNLRVSAEYARVGYSNLEPESNILLNGLVDAGSCGDFDRYGSPQTSVPCVVDQSVLSKFRIDDADEFHLGLEYEVGRSSVFFIRAGVWLDPDHQMRYQSGDDDVRTFRCIGTDLLPGSDKPSCGRFEFVDPRDPSNPDGLDRPADRFASRFGRGSDEIHLTGGLGLLPGGERYQMDLAFDLSKRVDVFTVSFVYYLEGRSR
ncbi:MAG: hypothetical protein GY769_08845 [bacterium]|nr:hypothetical protein [bacterium]